jgi:hypothetical protein
MDSAPKAMMSASSFSMTFRAAFEGRSISVSFTFGCALRYWMIGLRNAPESMGAGATMVSVRGVVRWRSANTTRTNDIQLSAGKTSCARRRARQTSNGFSRSVNGFSLLLSVKM